MLSQHGQYNVVFIFFINCLLPKANIPQVKTLCNVGQETPDNIAQEKKFILNVILILLGNMAQVKALCNVVQEAPENISQKKFCLMFS